MHHSTFQDQLYKMLNHTQHFDEILSLSIFTEKLTCFVFAEFLKTSCESAKVFEQTHRRVSLLDHEITLAF